MEERVYKKYGDTFTIINDRLCRVRHDWCGHEFDFDLNRHNPIVDFFRKNIRCPGCNHSFSIPDEICELMPEIEFSADENDLQKITCSCRHKFHFELEDIEPGPELDKIQCPNCGYKIRTSPPYLNKVEFRNPMQYTKLHNYDEFWRYLRVTEDIEEKLLVEFFNILDKDQLSILTHNLLLPYEKTEKIKQAFVLLVKNLGIDVITDDSNNFELFKQYYDRHYKTLITNYDEIEKSHWDKHGKRITGWKVCSCFEFFKYYSPTSEEIASKIQTIKNAVGEYGLNIIQPTWIEHGNIDDRTILTTTEHSVYGLLCECVINASEKSHANQYIDFIIWLYKQGFESTCNSQYSARCCGESEYFDNYKSDYSKALEIILNDPENAYDILHKQDK